METNSTVTLNDLHELETRLTDKLLSKEEFRQILTTLATKEELRQEVAKLATKEELRQEVAKLATKEELRQEVAKLATKEELRQEVAKLSTKESVEILANQVMRNTNDIADIKIELIGIRSEISEFRNDVNIKFDRIMTVVDHINQQFERSNIEKLATDHALHRHEEKIDNHETRISRLEKKAVNA